MAPGLNPSLRFHSVGSMATPLEFDGIDRRSKCTRRPVPLVGSATVKKSFGNGMRHFFAAMGSQRSAVAVATAGSHEKLAYPVSFPWPFARAARALIVVSPAMRSAAWIVAFAPDASRTSRLVISVVRVGSGQPATIHTRSVAGSRLPASRTSSGTSPDAGAWLLFAGATTCTPDGSAGPCPGNHSPGTRHPARTTSAPTTATDQRRAPITMSPRTRSRTGQRTDGRRGAWSDAALGARGQALGGVAEECPQEQPHRRTGARILRVERAVPPDAGTGTLGFEVHVGAVIRDRQAPQQNVGEVVGRVEDHHLLPARSAGPTEVPDRADAVRRGHALAFEVGVGEAGPLLPRGGVGEPPPHRIRRRRRGAFEVDD